MFNKVFVLALLDASKHKVRVHTHGLIRLGHVFQFDKTTNQGNEFARALDSLPSSGKTSGNAHTYALGPACI